MIKLCDKKSDQKIFDINIQFELFTIDHVVHSVRIFLQHKVPYYTMHNLNKLNIKTNNEKREPTIFN